MNGLKIPIKNQSSDYSTDSIPLQDKILESDDYIVNGKTLGTLYQNALNGVHEGGYESVTDILMQIPAEMMITISAEEIDDEAGDVLNGDNVIISARQYLIDLLIYETFDTNIGGTDDDGYQNTDDSTLDAHMKSYLQYLHNNSFGNQANMDLIKYFDNATEDFYNQSSFNYAQPDFFI